MEERAGDEEQYETQHQVLSVIHELIEMNWYLASWNPDWTFMKRRELVVQVQTLMKVTP